MTRPRKLYLMCGVASVVVAAVLMVGLHLMRPRQPHVQVILASDGEVMVAGIPGRSMRAQIQNRAFWNGESETSQQLENFLGFARRNEEAQKTYDGRILVLVDDHASFQILKMLMASARAAYPLVSYANGPVAEIPRASLQADKAYVKDCSTRPPPPGCFTVQR